MILYNEEIENQLMQLKKLIRLSMNGVASESMRQLGYKVHDGVALPRIKEIAGRFSKNHALAQRLWSGGSRETMIIATLLQPEESFPEKTALEWISQCNNIELVEQCCRNLFVRLPYSGDLAAKMLIQADKYKKTTGYILYSLLLMQERASDRELPLFFENASKDISNESYMVCSSIVRFLKQAGKKNRELVLDFLSGISLGGERAKWVYEEVLFFLEGE
jgi:3-methyladenine DNA glycosylase AlkD